MASRRGTRTYLVASRFISRKLKFQGNLAAVAIAVSFFVIIVAVAVSSGFRHTIREAVADMTGDLRVAPFPDTEELPAMSLEQGLADSLLALRDVRSVTPVAFRAGIVKSKDLVHGVMVKGIPGGADGTGQPLAVSIPRRLSEITGLHEGDDLTVYFVGEKVRVRKFHITRVHRDLLEVDENLLVYTCLEDIQRLNGWDDGQVSCLDVRVRDGSRAKLQELSFAIGALLEDYYVTTSAQTYPQLFDWLDLLDFNVLVVLILMTAVAAFNMVSGLLVMLLRNIPTIGTLKTLGMGNGAIGGLFVRIGAQAVLKGMLAGNAAGLLFCLVQGTTHLIPLDPANYFVAWVPVHVSVPALLAADAVAFALILGLLWLPTLVIATIDPATTVKAD